LENNSAATVDLWNDE